jgi:UNC-50 family
MFVRFCVCFSLSRGHPVWHVCCTVDGVQFFLLPLVLGKSLVALLVSNTLYAASFAWYWYITHLGYRALPFLSQTEVFLFPIAAIALVYVLNLIGYPFGLGWNASRVMAHIYFD